MKASWAGHVVFLLAIVLGVSCTREDALRAAVPVANGIASVASAAAPMLEERCSAPMAAARKVMDNDAAKRIAADCDKPMVAYRAVRLFHVQLRAAIVALYANAVTPQSLFAMLPQAAAAALAMKEAIEVLEAP